MFVSLVSALPSLCQCFFVLTVSSHLPPCPIVCCCSAVFVFFLFLYWCFSLLSFLGWYCLNVLVTSVRVCAVYLFSLLLFTCYSWELCVPVVVDLFNCSSSCLLVPVCALYLFQLSAVYFPRVVLFTCCSWVLLTCFGLGFLLSSPHFSWCYSTH